MKRVLQQTRGIGPKTAQSLVDIVDDIEHIERENNTTESHHKTTLEDF